MAISPIAIATTGHLNSPLSISVFGHLTIGLDDAVHPPGMGTGRRKIIRDDEEIMAIIVAFLEMKDH